MLGFGLWWLARAEARARRAGEGYDYTDPTDPAAAAADGIVRERATTAREFDPNDDQLHCPMYVRRSDAYR